MFLFGRKLAMLKSLFTTFFHGASIYRASLHPFFEKNKSSRGTRKTCVCMLQNTFHPFAWLHFLLDREFYESEGRLAPTSKLVKSIEFFLTYFRNSEHGISEFLLSFKTAFPAEEESSLHFHSLISLRNSVWNC